MDHTYDIMVSSGFTYRTNLAYRTQSDSRATKQQATSETGDSNASQSEILHLTKTNRD